MEEQVMDWKEELENLIKNGCTDSDIEDFQDNHPEVNGEDIWDHAYEYIAPKKCRGCRYVQMAKMFPCNSCSRRIVAKDFYEARENAEQPCSDS